MLLSIMLATLSKDDREFVTSIYNEYGKELLTIAKKILKNDQDANDALQETMCKIIKYIDKFNDDDKVSARNKIMIGLHASIRNTSFRLYSKKKKVLERESSFYYDSDDGEHIIDIEDDNGNPNDYVIKSEELRVIREALLDLSIELQDTINLVYYCDFSCVEAARFLGISDSAVRNRLFNARKKLKEALRGDFCE